jgi:hypothetical protein
MVLFDWFTKKLFLYLLYAPQSFPLDTTPAENVSIFSLLLPGLGNFVSSPVE